MENNDTGSTGKDIGTSSAVSAIIDGGGVVVKQPRNAPFRYVTTTTNRIKVCLSEYREEIIYSSATVALSGFLLTSITTLCTCNFKNQWGMSSTTFQRIYETLSCLFVLLLAWSLLNSVFNFKKLKASNFIECLEKPEEENPKGNATGET